MRWLFIYLTFAIIFTSCKENNQATSKKEPGYFDLQKFFNQEATRLQNLNPVISKTVSINSKEETRQLKIEDWKKELSLFADANINKEAWKGAFRVSRKPGVEVYSGNNSNIPVRNIEINRSGNKIIRIRVVTQTKNALYTSSDTLTYYPDSLYEVNKQQKIKLLEPRKYLILAKFK